MDELLVILDLDETLVHASESKLLQEPAFMVGDYFCYCRPNLKPFIQQVTERYRVAVWTASGEDYADGVVAKIFPAPHDLEFVWARSRCTQRFERSGELVRLKNLHKLRRRGHSLGRIVMVDDSPEKHTRNYGNLVAVSEFTGDADDDELPRLLEFIEYLAQFDDVRPVEKRSWRAKLDAGLYGPPNKQRY